MATRPQNSGVAVVYLVPTGLLRTCCRSMPPPTRWAAKSDALLDDVDVSFVPQRTGAVRITVRIEVTRDPPAYIGGRRKIRCLTRSTWLYR